MTTHARPCITFVGPVSGPAHGQLLATRSIESQLEQSGLRLRVFDTGSRGAGLADALRRLAIQAAALVSVLARREPVYVSLNSNRGVWLSALIAGAAARRQRGVSVHYHSARLVTERVQGIARMMRSFGPSDRHLLLCRHMAEQLAAVYEVRGTCEVLNNAALVEPEMQPARGTRESSASFVVGHLSNLCEDKGTDAFLDAVEHLARRDDRVRVRLAGPTLTPEIHDRVVQAGARLGDRFEYLGPVSGSEKIAFFQSLDLFVFPTRYVHEAEPLVLLESLACGVPCVASARCCIAGDLADAGIVLSPEGGGLDEAIATVIEDHSRFHRRARARFDELDRQSAEQLGRLAAALSGQDSGNEVRT